ncbi:response regulator [Flavobacterium sp.]
MSKLKAALLDDNKEQLLVNQQLLENYGLVTVVSACTSSEAFLAEVKISQPDILFLDLNLGDSYMTGMEVAFQLKIPVLFVSSDTAKYIKEIEKLKKGIRFVCGSYYQTFYRKRIPKDNSLFASFH